MNKQEELKDDLLKRYVNCDKIEEAPEGFTQKVMQRVLLESPKLERKVKPNLIPVISAGVFILLLLIAFLLPGNEQNPANLKIITVIKSMFSSIPDVRISSLFRITLPSVLLYVIPGIFVLMLFDRALNRIFHKE